jgi:Terminase large subunit, T4likevirus-type, N-terminal
MALDPARMMTAAGLKPDDWQARVLRSSAPRMLLNCSRQSGKSTVTGALASHTALYEPGSLILILAQAQRQAEELHRKCRVMLGAHPSVPRLLADSVEEMELSNGSRIVALPSKEATIRGFSGVRLLIIDEAARVPDGLYYAVRPMLATSGGRLLALSTPFGNRGWWFEAWRSSESWERYEVPATACPRIPAGFLEEERRTIGEFWYRQEYGCEFLDAQTAAFRLVDIERAFAEEVETWDL